LPPERVKNASGLFNLTRNLGGAVGLAIINTQLNDRIDLHLARLHDAVTWSRPAAMEMLNNLTQRFASYGSDAHAMALKQMSLLARREGIVMGYADIFLMLTVLFIALSLMSVILSKPAPAAAGAGGGH
jgi:DHA2 family multidrug resistance protein